jgi:osmotically inducible lipoprotein OsmB
MKRLLVLMVCFFIWTGESAVAGDRVADWTAGGAIGGAILGQMIGGDAGATIVGAAAGGMLGYVIGADQERYRSARTVYAPYYGRNDGRRIEARYVYGRAYVAPRCVSPPPAYGDRHEHDRGWHGGNRWRNSGRYAPAWESKQYNRRPATEVMVRIR